MHSACFLHFLELGRIFFFLKKPSLSLFFPFIQTVSTPVLYLSNPITVNIVTAQISILQKSPVPEPMAYLLGACWFCKDAVRPSEGVWQAEAESVFSELLVSASSLGWQGTDGHVP